MEIGRRVRWWCQTRVELPAGEPTDGMRHGLTNSVEGVGPAGGSTMLVEPGSGAGELCSEELSWWPAEVSDPCSLV